MCRFCLNTCSHIVWSTVICKEPLSSCSIHYLANFILSFSSGGNSSCTMYSLCRISVIARVQHGHATAHSTQCCCLLFCDVLFCVSWCRIIFFFLVCFSILQDRGIGNTSLSTFGVAQAVLEIILMLYPLSDLPFVCGRSSMLHGQEQHCQGSFVYSGHS